jgi:probable HAF family extracellular repeat protein
MVDLGTLGGSTSAVHESGQVVNESGQVVGYSETASGQQHAFLWTQAGGMVDLGTLGGSRSVAVAVNESGQVVGWSDTAAGERHATLWQPRDTAPPTLTVPADLAVNATSPGGALVAFSASAVDDVDGVVPVSCLPASGSLFPIGLTTVSCTATATGDANSPVTATFTVTVNGATAQLQALLASVTGVGPGKSLANKVRQIQGDVAVNDTSDACATLAAFINEVNAQTGKKIQSGTTLPSQAGSLIATASRIETVLGC